MRDFHCPDHWIWVRGKAYKRPDTWPHVHLTGGRTRYFLFAPDAMNICARLYASTTNVMFGTLGLVGVRWPDKIHRQVMAALDILALAAMVGALAVSLHVATITYVLV